MIEVNGSYRELTGFQPVELSDNSFAAEKLHTEYRPLSSRAVGSLTPAVEDR